MDVTPAPLTADEITKDLDFKVGQQYVRMDLHEVCGGNHQPGISPITDLSAIFLFSSPTKNKPEYEDKWLPNDHFRLTGVGREGDQLWKGSPNKSLANHKKDNRRVFLFERVPGEKPTVVTYVGEFEYVTHEERCLLDRNRETRQAYQFELRPVDGETVELPDDANELDLASLYEQAKRAAGSGTSRPPARSNKETDTIRSEVVRKFALREADGVCQGCNSPAPFKKQNDDPYLEIHHVTRVSDEGPDHPDNVIALCPNCHSEVHNGKKGNELNERLRRKSEERAINASRNIIHS